MLASSEGAAAELPARVKHRQTCASAGEARERKAMRRPCCLEGATSPYQWTAVADPRVILGFAHFQ